MCTNFKNIYIKILQYTAFFRYNVVYASRCQCDDKHDRHQMKIFFHRARFEPEFFH